MKKTEQVRVGEDLAIQLDANSPFESEADQWALFVPPSESVLRFVGSQYKGDQRPGGRGIETWLFHAVARGTTKVELSYMQATLSPLGGGYVFTVRVD